MIVYLDTGIFIDYLASRGHQASGLRTCDRRSRPLAQIFTDAEKLLTKSKGSAYTSALTFYEAEEALFKQLSLAAKGVSQASVLLVPMARAIVSQIHTTVRLFDITVCDLSVRTIQAQLRERELDTRGVRAADSIHVMTASQVDADILASGDDALLELDGVIRNSSGKVLRCVDSDAALRII